MLLEIASLPSPENSAIQLHPADNIAVARVPLAVGTELRVGGEALTARDAIPAGHKVALRGIAAGATVFRYGQPIGLAKASIEPGSHVHTHNLAFDERRAAYQFPSVSLAEPARREDGPSFLGYLRDDGRAGTRNYIAVVAASNCAAHTAELIAASYASETLPPNVDGVVAFPHG